ncbi:MAG: hypothetical protein LBH74_01945 [Nitrososphaerota archaeon]|uniref:hypothetical protein n=1 Tax=Candidatus Bathycorpusculum sp. TaxID=2994959 RepID=UPI0028357A0E|nr:hypothetical protein [Candidatus Termitimicrobium sp.]MCL2431694.1 hypothetical protein [Candidatus Termitimicrobium sp.]MDR0492390.1 hypothetical protein [Nitrososphaerota archaeon]
MFIIALFGTIIFVANMFLPPPLNYLMMVVQAVFLALSALFIKKTGAMYAGAVGGLLTALLSGSSLGPFTFFFSFLFGVLVDLFLYIFKIKGTPSGVNQNRLIAAMALSTLMIAVSSYSAFALLPQSFNLQKVVFVSLFVQPSPMLTTLVLFMGPATGAVAGYATAYLWNKYLRHISI